MTLSLELGQVTDAAARRALEQVALRWPDPLRVPVVSELPAAGTRGLVVFLTSDSGLYVYSEGWKKA